MNNISYLLALQSVSGLGPVRLNKLLEYFTDPKIAWNGSRQEFLQLGIPQNVVDLFINTRNKLDPEDYADKITKSGIKWITVFDEKYPKLLKQIYDPPVILFYKGIVDWNRRAIAVVGTRKITGYGRSVTEQFTKGLVEAGLTIVSGLARGVDTKAHQTAIEAGGQTIAVLGGGLNNIYPTENIILANKIINGYGAVVSEFPPDEHSTPGNFPARNRIISGLSMAVLVTEAAVDSGSLITAKLAVEQGRDVYAVPGAITSDLSKGPVMLIQTGAKPVFDPNEILEDLNIVQKSNISVDTTDLNEKEKKVLEILENEQLHIDEICRSINLPISEVSGIVLKMEISGLLRNLGGGIYSRA